MDNLVLVLEHERGLSRRGALTGGRAEVDRRIADFQRLAAELPDLCRRLGLDPTQVGAVETYVRVMGAWIGGYHAWQTRNGRFRRGRGPRAVRANLARPWRGPDCCTAHGQPVTVRDGGGLPGRPP
ncbi:hypothetical protein ACFYUY_12095 [Kitasatospora sp. NPDC004745]|uniref:hypothetical protein n=1 Tax=Kitasatospora sp. NPDC004745 TaxID=3364019 RepID=UPI0036BCA771